MIKFVHLPGFGNLGPNHWQSRWEDADASILRFSPSSWEAPDLTDWLEALERAISSVDQPVILVAHSLACLLIAHWHEASTTEIAGAFLVAPPDPTSPAFPTEILGFGNLPTSRFCFRSLMVVSEDDPYASLSFAHRYAEHWGSDVHLIGKAGHINGESGLNDWSQGIALRNAFAQQVLEDQ